MIEGQPFDPEVAEDTQKGQEFMAKLEERKNALLAKIDVLQKRISNAFN